MSIFLVHVSEVKVILKLKKSYVLVTAQNANWCPAKMLMQIANTNRTFNMVEAPQTGMWTKEKTASHFSAFFFSLLLQLRCPLSCRRRTKFVRRGAPLCLWCWMSVSVNIHAFITNHIPVQNWKTTVLQNISISFISPMFSIYIKLHKLRHSQLTTHK